MKLKTCIHLFLYDYCVKKPNISEENRWVTTVSVLVKCGLLTEYGYGYLGWLIQITVRSSRGHGFMEWQACKALTSHLYWFLLSGLILNRR